MTQETSTPQAEPRSQRVSNWKLPIMIGGGLLGAAIGAVAARLFIRSDEIVLEHDRQRGPQGIGFSPLVMLPLAITLVGLIREIGGLAGGKPEK